jgi:hypothetical protein
VNGTGVSGPQQANIIQPTTADQATNAYNQVGNNLQQQQLFLQMLNGQNGAQNQSSVFNQLQGVANGTGPNPAQAMLNQSTGANTANQAALMAGQRGTGANAGLIARQAAQQGAANQQNAAGQGATMQANQSLNALNQLGGIAGQQVSQQQSALQQLNQNQQSEQQQLLNAIQGQNSANVQSQASVNSANSTLANTTMQGQQGLTGGLMNAAGPASSVLMGAKGGQVPTARVMAAGGYAPVSADYNNTDNVNYGTGATDMSTVGPQSPSIPTVPVAAPPSVSTTQTPSNSPGKFTSFLKSKAAGASGQATPSQFDYGNPGANQLAAGFSNAITGAFKPSSSSSQQATNPTLEQQANATAAFMGAPGTTDANGLPTAQATADFMQGSGSGAISGAKPDDYLGSNNQTETMPADNDSSMPMAAKGGKVPALVSPGERYLPPKEVEKVVKGKKDPMKAGEKIPGKPKVGGAVNSYANDTVKKNLDEGGIVLPRSVTQAKHPHWAAHAFVSQIMAKNGNRLPKKAK